MDTKEKTIYDTYPELCSVCGAGEKSWHHNPSIGGSALDHKFEPSRSVMEALVAIGHGRPFGKCELSDFEFYALRSWALAGIHAAAANHAPCEKQGCDICTLREMAARHATR